MTLQGNRIGQCKFRSSAHAICNSETGKQYWGKIGHMPRCPYKRHAKASRCQQFKIKTDKTMTTIYIHAVRKSTEQLSLEDLNPDNFNGLEEWLNP